MIEVRGLGVTFPGATRPALTDIDLDVAPGEQVLVLAASGGGKSTLLRVLAGIVPQVLDAHVSGEVRIGGLDATRTPTADLAIQVGTLTQDPSGQLCLPTVADEVAFALENRGVDPALIGPAVQRTLEAVGAAHLLDRRTSELSGGEGQRVALAAAQVADPSVLLLDEPTALLDPAAATVVARAVRAAAAPGRSTVLVEHRLDELPSLPDRVLVLGRDGRVHADGPTRRVLHEDAAALAALGTWLPLSAELAAAGVRDLGRLTVEREPPTPPGPRVLTARGLCVRRGGRTVLQGVDLDVQAGTVTAVVGLNGSGKSSLLLALAGLLPATGTVTGRSVGLVFQHPEHQLLARTVRDEIAWGPRRARASDVDARVSDALTAFRLTGLEDRDPFRLSGGQQRRLSLAAMAACGHDVLLADEPTFGQDRRTSAACADALRRLADEGRGVVLVTHDLRLVGEVADEVLVLRAGRVLAHGPVDAVLADDALLRLAGLPLPPLLAAWRTSGRPVRATLRALRAATASMTVPA
ncbi:ABC transporter ATP-binding protein [uncultured Cellulomonas sp.]|uniref:ABC transporter ATP-binding protein n=1 Tax=uncultured Cellulomonas sp. TaxID=189682 RepID=UPI0028E9E78E|nr:ABC transporter ATP-binding protein [uncultured Cellulomonas sp.]